MKTPKFQLGDHVEVNKPGHGMHGMHGFVEKVVPAPGPRYLDYWLYLANWKFSNGVNTRWHAPERYLNRKGEKNEVKTSDN